MSSHSVLDIPAFRIAFPAFSNVTTYPNAMLNLYYANAGFYISQNDAWCGLSGAQLDYVLQSLLAHILYCAGLIAAGQTNVIISGSTVADVSVTLEPPQTKSGWEWWLCTSPYGQQLWALLQMQSAGGWAIGGLPETSAFRKVGGFF